MTIWSALVYSKYELVAVRPYKGPPRLHTNTYADSGKFQSPMNFKMDQPRNLKSSIACIWWLCLNREVLTFIFFCLQWTFTSAMIHNYLGHCKYDISQFTSGFSCIWFCGGLLYNFVHCNRKHDSESHAISSTWLRVISDSCFLTLSIIFFF